MECFFLLSHYLILQQAEFHHLCIVQDKSFQPTLMQQVTCHIYTWHTRDFNFACNIKQGLTCLHALSLPLLPTPSTVKPAASHHRQLPPTTINSHKHQQQSTWPQECHITHGFGCKQLSTCVEGPWTKYFYCSFCSL